MSRKNTNTCHICLKSMMANLITNCPLCSHKTCSSCLVDVSLEGQPGTITICDKCTRNEKHRHPTGHHYVRRPA